MNAGSSSYPAAWPGTWAVTSYDSRAEWRRTPTTYDSATGELCVEVDPAGHSFLYVAYFAPFSYEQHLSLIEDCVAVRAQMAPPCAQSKRCAPQSRAASSTRSLAAAGRVSCGSSPGSTQASPWPSGGRKACWNGY